MAVEKRVLVTGAGGLVGRTLLPMIIDDYEVVCFDQQELDVHVPCIVGDLRDSTAVAEACAGMDLVLHIGALHGAAWGDAGDDVGFEVNVVGTKNVLEADGPARSAWCSPPPSGPRATARPRPSICPSTRTCSANRPNSTV
jgi:nucleoside-diphosphate-sugar epimerase